MKNIHVPVEKKSLSFVHHNANQVRTVYNGHRSSWKKGSVKVSPRQEN